MNANDARARVKSLAGKSANTNLDPPGKLERQTNKIHITEDTGDDGVDVEKGLVGMQEQAQPPVVEDTAAQVPKEPSSMETFNMFIQGSIMASSTSMSGLNGQLQKLQQEVMERQNQMNEVKSKMLNVQGSISMLHNVNAKLRDLKLVTDCD
jgi:hypothetical protein